MRIYTASTCPSVDIRRGLFHAFINNSAYYSLANAAKKIQWKMLRTLHVGPQSILRNGRNFGKGYLRIARSIKFPVWFDLLGNSILRPPKTVPSHSGPSPLFINHVCVGIVVWLCDH